ncbi:unnamed protein product [Cuscuta europaea]|uniref:Uncharacterized protein n=1 Tax=Cuscuta europaea TaxID=41803 RepID=A0A9P0YPV6_CUSEU|nr:unnamed protein product [Cuscuta europaea]
MSIRPSHFENAQSKPQTLKSCSIRHFGRKKTHYPVNDLCSSHVALLFFFFLFPFHNIFSLLLLFTFCLSFFLPLLSIRTHAIQTGRGFKVCVMMTASTTATAPTTAPLPGDFTAYFTIPISPKVIFFYNWLIVRASLPFSAAHANLRGLL